MTFQHYTDLIAERRAAAEAIEQRTFAHWHLSPEEFKGAAMAGVKDFARVMVARALYSLDTPVNPQTKLDFSKLDLSDVDLTQAIISDADFRESDLSGARMQSGVFQRCLFDGASLDYAHADNASFDLSAMVSTSFTHARAVNASFKQVIAGGIKFRHSDLTSASFAHARLMGAWFNFADLSKAVLANAICDHAHFNHAILYRALLNRTSFYYADVDHADFDAAQGHHVSFKFVNVSRASFHNAFFVDMDTPLDELTGFFSLRVPYMSSRHDALRVINAGTGTQEALSFLTGCFHGSASELVARSLDDGDRRKAMLYRLAQEFARSCDDTIKRAQALRDEAEETEGDEE